MQQVKNGDTIKVHYHGRLEDGTTFDSSEGREPFEFTVGSGNVIKGFDEGVLGMTPGEKKTIHIAAEDAYGPAYEENIIPFPREQFPPDIDPQVGLELHMRSQNGQEFRVVVKEVNEEVVVLDANNRLAGKDLIFDLELVEIR